MKISAIDRERIKFHLAITDAVPSSDRAYADMRLGRSRSEIVIKLIKANLDGLEATYQLITDTSSVIKTESITGDVNRTIVNTEAAIKTIWARYLAQCRLLSESVGIPNYRGEGLGMSGGESAVIQTIMSPDGSSVGSRLYMSEIWC